MEIIRKINTIIICVIISLVLTPVIICAFPFCTIMEIAFFVIELFGEDAFYHNLWASFVLRCINSVKEIYLKMIKESDPL